MLEPAIPAEPHELPPPPLPPGSKFSGNWAHQLFPRLPNSESAGSASLGARLSAAAGGREPLRPRQPRSRGAASPARQAPGAGGARGEEGGRGVFCRRSRQRCTENMLKHPRLFNYASAPGGRKPGDFLDFPEVAASRAQICAQALAAATCGKSKKPAVLRRSARCLQCQWPLGLCWGYFPTPRRES